MVLLATACSSTHKPESAAEAPFEMSEEDLEALKAVVTEAKCEIDLGRKIAAKVAGTKGVVKEHTESLRYLNLILQTLVRQSGRPELQFSIAILDDEEPNAFAAPGGFIFVTKGLLAALHDESELAGVLGHEVAHVNERHLVKDACKPKQMSAVEQAARIVGGGRGDISAGFSKLVNEGVQALLETGLGQELEGVADDVGIMYSSSAGYDPEALPRFLQRLAKASTELKLGKTHPPFDVRLQKLGAFERAQGLDKVKTKNNSRVLEERFQKYLAPFRIKS